MNIYSLSAALLSASALLTVGTSAHAATQSITPTAGKVITATEPSAFATPSGKTFCLIYGDKTTTTAGVRCDIYDGSKVTTAPKPANCEFDWGQGMVLGGVAQVSCISDAVGETAKVGSDYTKWWNTAKTPVVKWGTMKAASLPYGSTLKFRNISCTTAKTGTTCVNTQTKHGFTMWSGGHKKF